jgi:hypothetical protein
MKKIRTVITVETEEVWIIRDRRSPVREWCSECGEQARMVTLAEAVALGGVGSRVIYHRVEAGGIHYAETPAGLLLFCETSLLDPATQTDRPLPDGLATGANDSFVLFGGFFHELSNLGKSLVRLPQVVQNSKAHLVIFIGREHFSLFGKDGRAHLTKAERPRSFQAHRGVCV